MRRKALWALAILLSLGAAAAWQTGLLGLRLETGYYSPVFTADGESVIAVRREVSATITGFGYEFFTPPATVRVHRDRFALVSLRASDGRMTVLQRFAASPLEGQKFEAYHGAIFGSPQVHLRWEGNRLQYEIGVTRYATPSSRTFVLRGEGTIPWLPPSGGRGRDEPSSSAWKETYAGMGGDEAQQLYGDAEAIAVPGEEAMPCAVALLRRDTVQVLEQTGVCRRRYRAGITAADLAPISRRAAIERMETIRRTSADLVRQNRAAGLPEGEAILKADKEMERLGYYPKSTTLVAQTTTCDATPLFTISDDEFRFGMFSDIERAVASPGEEVDKSMGDYVIHRDYRTSAALNEYLKAGHTTFVVRARGACWRLTISRPR